MAVVKSEELLDLEMCIAALRVAELADAEYGPLLREAPPAIRAALKHYREKRHEAGKKDAFRQGEKS